MRPTLPDYAKWRTAKFWRLRRGTLAEPFNPSAASTPQALRLRSPAYFTRTVQTILERLLLEIRESVPSSSHISVLAMDDSGFTIQLGRAPDAVITVTLQDSAQPSFSVTYPALVVSREGDESVGERTAEIVLSQGVSWIVRKVFRFGFVPPEGYRRPQRNAGKPEHP